MSKYLIINADDFGISNSVNKAIQKLKEENKISSATLMPNVEYYDDAVIWSKKNSKDIGLHITLMNDDSKFKNRSLSRLKSLEDENGFLYEDINKFRKSFKYKDIKQEINLQFEKLYNSGIDISHVDIHRYAIYPTYNPIVYTYICKKCRQYNKLPMRWSKNGGYNILKGINNLCDSDNVSKFFAAIANLYDIPIPDYVFKFPYRNTFKTYEEKKNAFIEMIGNLPEGISEVHIHPSIESEEIKNNNPTWKERVFEFELMMDEDIQDALKKEGIKLITYKEIRNINNHNKSKMKSIYEILYYGIKYIVKKIIKNHIEGDMYDRKNA